jgi:acyl-CoA reductase-like NAD-dependent aldehyde dehydrogenase
MSSTLGIINPSTEREIASINLASIEETDAAIDIAAQTALTWKKVNPADRARLLRHFAEVVDAHNEELAQLEVANSGHTISNARWEAGNVRDVLNYYSGAPERHSGKQIPVAGGLDLTFYEPLGVVGIIVPWNFPMPIAGWGFGPALAAGNTVVLKPAVLTPLTAIRLGELALEAGIPEGVFQVVTGDGSMVGNRFVTHPAVRKVCFTGSNAVGRIIMEGCAAQVKRVTLELGGKSANIVFGDADLEKAAAQAPYAVFDNAGQDCCARSRLLVEASAYDRFMEYFEPAVKGVKVQDPTSDESEMGPLITSAQRDSVRAYVNESEVAFTGQAPDGPGYWMAPTVLETSDHAAPSFQEEIFGPVVSVVRFRDEADAIAIANDSVYGLSGSIWSRDIAKALRVARGVETGALSVNSNSSVRYSTPFGGFKHSGLGRELGPDALLGFSEEKNVFISTEDN